MRQGRRQTASDSGERATIVIGRPCLSHFIFAVKRSTTAHQGEIAVFGKANRPTYTDQSRRMAAECYASCVTCHGIHSPGNWALGHTRQFLLI